MKKLLYSTMAIFLLAGFAACSHTTEVVSTNDAVYRFKAEGGNSTKVERCEVQGASAQCKNVEISFE
ncbi:MAG: hypothetical protein RH862_09415 [Leptospiraceae bacterium]